MQAIVARPSRSAEEEQPNEKERVLCHTHVRVLLLMALMPTGLNADHRKWQHVTAMLHGWHTANHHLAV